MQPWVGVDMPNTTMPQVGTAPEIVYRPARELAAGLKNGELGAEELMQAYLARIEECNPGVNAICTQLPGAEAIDLARAADTRRVRGEDLGPLHGLPIAVKDLSATRGMRTTMGSPIFADHIPEEDSLLVQRLRSAGALVIGKTNTPEMGAGSHTFNPVFGVTRNPWNLARSAGGSSGGAAAALSAGMLPLADGSDMGGSLRNPAAFCGIVGLRPSMGRVPNYPSSMAWQSRMGIEGPMARDVQDCALLLSVLAGPDERDPRSLQDDPACFAGDLRRNFSGARVAWTPDLGILPVESAVVEACERALGNWEDCGSRVEHACPNLGGAMDVFKTLRAVYYGQVGGPLLSEHRSRMKDTLIGNIELGLSLSAMDVAAADAERTRLFHQLLSFFREYDFLVMPTTQVQPFEVETEWVREIEGQVLPNYLDWMSSCCIFSVFDLPAISVPCGFTQQGLPVGLQIIGRPRADYQVLQAALAFEQAAGHGVGRPPCC